MIKNKHLRLCASGLAGCASVALAQTPATGSGQAYPVKAIRIVIALAPGGGVDTSGRMLGQRFSDAWGQPVVAENRPGAGGTIATEMVARAAPDGYTLLMTSLGHAITPAMYKLNFDAIKDFAPISLFVQSPSVLAVHPSLPAKNVKELIKLHGEIARMVADPPTRERLLKMGLDPAGTAPDDFAAYLKTETVKWSKLVREAGIRAN